MHEATLRDFFAGTADGAALRADLVGAVEAGEGFRRHHIVDMAQSFQITGAHLIRLCDAILAGALSPEDLQPIGFCIIA
jgi:hypothetical protein